MVSRVACLENSWAESFGFPENSGQGAPAHLHLPPRCCSNSTTHSVCRASRGSCWHFQEREAAKKLFVTPDGLMTQLATTLSTTVSTQSAIPGLTIDEPKPMPLSGKAGRLMTKEERERVKAAIASAKSIEDIRKLERSLREGYLPEMESIGA